VQDKHVHELLGCIVCRHHPWRVHEREI
jgi:hypothetical protein